MPSPYSFFFFFHFKNIALAPLNIPQTLSLQKLILSWCYCVHSLDLGASSTAVWESLCLLGGARWGVQGQWFSMFATVIQFRRKHTQPHTHTYTGKERI